MQTITEHRFLATRAPTAVNVLHLESEIIYICLLNHHDILSKSLQKGCLGLYAWDGLFVCLNPHFYRMHSYGERRELK
jgi:hypothetical protein